VQASFPPANTTMAIPNRGPQLFAVDIAFVITAVFACSLRCFVRVRMVKAFGLDDWLMVIATVSHINGAIKYVSDIGL
jgi:hypothetical protein